MLFDKSSDLHQIGRLDMLYFKSKRCYLEPYKYTLKICYDFVATCFCLQQKFTFWEIKFAFKFGLFLLLAIKCQYFKFCRIDKNTNWEHTYSYYSACIKYIAIIWLGHSLSQSCIKTWKHIWFLSFWCQ